MPCGVPRPLLPASAVSVAAEPVVVAVVAAGLGTAAFCRRVVRCLADLAVAEFAVGRLTPGQLSSADRTWITSCSVAAKNLANEEEKKAASTVKEEDSPLITASAPVSGAVILKAIEQVGVGGPDQECLLLRRSEPRRLEV